MLHMDTDEKWEKLSIELPPGWHAAMQTIARLTGGVPLKCLYALAIDQFLAKLDRGKIEDAAWLMHRSARKDVSAVAARHSAAEVEKRLSKRSPRVSPKAGRA
jgi:DNA polymerase elongation subunit (family B)